MADPVLQVHLEPQEPIRVSELTAALGSLARQYEGFAVQTGLIARAADAKLLVSSVAPGSIDISLLPDWETTTAVVGTPLFIPLIDKFEVLKKFAEHIKALIDYFSGETTKSEITVK